MYNKNIKFLKLLSFSFYISLFFVISSVAMDEDWGADFTDQTGFTAVDTLLANEKRDDWPLHSAAKAQNIERVEKLLNEGFGVNDEDYAGFTPLYEAIANLPVDFKDSEDEKRRSIAVVSLLVSRGAKLLEPCGNAKESVMDLVDRLVREQDSLIEEYQKDARMKAHRRRNALKRGRASASYSCETTDDSSIIRARKLIEQLENIRAVLVSGLIGPRGKKRD
jgi:ankyrin repeat protein